MNIPLTLNIGDTVWIWQLGNIRSEKIHAIYITLKEGRNIEISYQTDRYTSLRETDEGFWFKSREDAIAYVQRTVICANLPCPEPPSQGLVTLKSKLLKKLFG